MESFIQHLINGVAFGSIYALIALGYTLVYGILKLINFAHGDLIMVGAYTGLFTAMALGIADRPGLGGFCLVLLASMAVSGCLGLAVERFAYRPLRQAPRINLLMTAVGVSLLLENLGQIFFKPDPRAFPAILPAAVLLQWGQVAVNNHQALVLAVSLMLMLVLEWIVLRTGLGRAMRAASHSHETAALVGVPVDKIVAFTFFIGSCLAAAAGILMSVSYPRVDPFMGILPGLKAFVAAVLGGIGNLRGAVLGAVILGLAEEMVAGYFSSSYRDALVFSILIVVLLLKPAGLLGTNKIEKV